MQVHLVDLGLPRVRILLSEEALNSYDAALAASKRAIVAATPPRLRVDLTIPAVYLTERQLPLTKGQVVWNATLAIVRRRSEGWILSDDFTVLHQTLTACRAAKDMPMWTPPGNVFTNPSEYPDYSKMRSKTRKLLRTFCSEHGVMRADLVVPSIQKAGHGYTVRTAQRVALTPEFIELTPRCV
ncbi:MAG: hypothetical protein ACI9MC_003514 [Kiritimatiellia bacterium]